MQCPAYVSGPELPNQSETAMSAGQSPLHEYRQGDVIGSKYALERMLGVGGMGAVWVARDIVLETTVAVKLIRPELSNGEAAQRLLDEARAEARLSHPAVVRAFDFGNTEHGDPYIAMELLEGRSFGDLLRRCDHISPVMAIQVLLPVLDALAYAHARGVIHRDLTPENIFLSRKQRHIQPKIVDFGIALLATRPVRRITENGTIVGCPRYMSPEQARGEDDVDHRTDLWTVCVVLYEAVTGCSPFDAENYNAALRAVMGRTLMPLTELDIGDKELWTILEKGFSRERDSRWQSARQLGTALAKWLLGQGVSTDISGDPIGPTWVAENSSDESPRDILDDIIARESESLAPCARSERTSGKTGYRWSASGNRIVSSGAELARALFARADTLPMKTTVAIAGSGILLSVLLGIGRGHETPSTRPGDALEGNAFAAQIGQAGPACRPGLGTAPNAGPEDSAPAIRPSDEKTESPASRSSNVAADQLPPISARSAPTTAKKARLSVSSNLQVHSSAPRATALSRPPADWPLRDPNYP